jgi:ABC-type dipeptide/oligopeptide/nickel transport system permease component
LLSESPDFVAARKRSEFSSAVAAWERLRKNPRRWRNFIPVFRFHGKDCRYHRWLTTGGVSYRDFRPVGEKVREALWRTLGLNAAALILGVGLGLATAVGTFGRPRPERWVKNLCLGMYSVPTFWAATMLVTLFAGGVWSVFPTRGWSPAWEDGAVNVVADRLWPLTLPLVCLVYPLWAFWTLQFRQSLHAESVKPYVTAARAWGLSEKRILFPMMMKNAAGPSLALLAASLPGMLAGSFVVETLFSMPGMGLLAYEAVVFRDYPVLTSVFFVSAAVTLVANFLADIIVLKIYPTTQQK